MLQPLAELHEAIGLLSGAEELMEAAGGAKAQEDATLIVLGRFNKMVDSWLDRWPLRGCGSGSGSGWRRGGGPALGDPGALMALLGLRLLLLTTVSRALGPHLGGGSGADKDIAVGETHRSG